MQPWKRNSGQIQQSFFPAESHKQKGLVLLKESKAFRSFFTCHAYFNRLNSTRLFIFLFCSVELGTMGWV